MTTKTQEPQTATPAPASAPPAPAISAQTAAVIAQAAKPAPPPRAADITWNRPPVPAAPDPLLVRILSWKRPFESKPEIEFMTWLGQEVASYKVGTQRIGTRGNLIVTVPRKDNKTVSTLFSCHTDTVHHGSVAEPKQTVVYDPNFGHIFLDKADPNAGSCLGADDGVGVWIMLGMIENGVPGTYVFHRGEERGCVGSNAMLTAEKAWLENFDCAIAFDRPNNYEVITHQGGERTCSDKFGNKLALLLNEQGKGHLKYETSNRGVFTDTRTYRYVIAECTNIGVGYSAQHSQNEMLDYGHAYALRAACIALDWESLPVDRDPAAAKPVYTGASSHGGYGGYQGSLSLDEDREDALWTAASRKTKKGKKGVGLSTPPVAPPPSRYPTTSAVTPTRNLEDEFRDTSVSDTVAWIENDVEQAARLMLEMAAEMAGLRTQVNFMKGAL